MVKLKICSDCNINKDTAFFNKKSNKCKDCQKIYNKNYNLMNSFILKEKKHLSYLENAEEIKETSRSYTKNNKEKISVNKKRYHQENREAIISYKKKYNFNQYQTNEIFRLKNNLRTRLNGALRSTNWKIINSLSEYLGCTVSELKTHLEKQFTSEMSWENKGMYGWHIDHIIPLAKANSIEELFQLCHYTNLQPLWALDNWRKNDKHG